VIAGLAAVGLAIVALVTSIALSGQNSDRLPAGPVAAVQDDHLATVGTEGVARRVAMVAGTGATTTRFDIFWSDIAPTRPAHPRDPADPAYDWRRVDAIAHALAARDITPITALYATPAWATPLPPLDPAPIVNPNAPRPAAFADVMAAVATRYSGHYVPPGASEPLPELRRLELWNEPNLDAFMYPQESRGKRRALPVYIEMVRRAYPAIKEANPNAVVIAGAAGPVGSTGPTRTGAITWLDGLRSAGVPMDAYSQHIYPSAPPKVPTSALPSWSSVGRLLEGLDGIAPGLPLYITEAGYTTADTDKRDRKVTETQQAQYLTDIFALPQMQNDRIHAVVWFNLQDNVAWPAGLLREDGTAKPSMRAFTDVVRRQEGARLG